MEGRGAEVLAMAGMGIKAATRMPHPVSLIPKSGVASSTETARLC